MTAREKKKRTLSYATGSNVRCNTRPLIIPFRVNVAEWKLLLKKAGGKGNVSNFIRKKLGFSK